VDTAAVAIAAAAVAGEEATDRREASATGMERKRLS
jgi:hypothetical protein